MNLALEQYSRIQWKFRYEQIFFLTMSDNLEPLPQENVHLPEIQYPQYRCPGQTASALHREKIQTQTAA